jgi:hypothetical protein
MRTPSWFFGLGGGSSQGRSSNSNRAEDKNKKDGDTKTKDTSSPKGKAERCANWLTSMRTVIVNLFIACLVGGGIVYSIYFNHIQVVIRDVDVSAFGSSPPDKSDVLQRRITEAFRATYRAGGDAMPEQVISESIANEAELIDFQVPEIGISFNKLKTYILSWIPWIPADANVDSIVAPNGKKGYTLHATLNDGKESVVFEDKGDALEPLFQKAASQLLRKRNPYVYASGLSVQERKECYANDRHCDFAEAILAYQTIYDGNATGTRPDHYRDWAMLAASKIREDQRAYEDEIELARRAIDDWPPFSWAYYNWGVALAELNCYDGAIRAFSTMISLKKGYAAAYNARGRIHLLLAEAQLRAGNGYDTPDRRKAMRDFRAAIAAVSDYPEAQINLGKAYALNPNEQRLARVNFESVAEAPDLASTQAARAWQQLAFLERDAGDDATYRDDIAKANHAMATNTVCRFAFAHSLLEGSGCMETATARPQPDLSTSLKCRMESSNLALASNDAL